MKKVKSIRRVLIGAALSLGIAGGLASWSASAMDVARLPLKTANLRAATKATAHERADDTASCAAVCWQAPEYYLNNITRWPRGAVVMAGVNFGNPISASHAAIIRLALQGNGLGVGAPTPWQQFNRQYVAAQLTLLGQSSFAGVTRSLLSCYGLNFATIRLSSGAALTPATKLGDLLDAARRAAREQQPVDLEAIATVLALLNGDDPLGGCGRTRAVATGEDAPLKPAVRAALEAALAESRAQESVPGAVIGVWIPGEGSYITAQGVSDLNTGAPIGVNDRFRIGSITKTFTGTVILQLVDEGKIKLDDPLSLYIAGVPNGGRITIRQALQMTSGLYNYSEDREFNQSLDDFPARVWTPNELLAIAYQGKPYFTPPGAGYHYSNTNTILLGLLIEQVTGNSLAREFERRIFGPLGMRDTLLPELSSTAIPAPHPRGYMYGTNVSTLDDPAQSDGPYDQTDASPSWTWAAGGAISTLRDLRIWAKALATGALLKPETQAERLKFVPISPTSNLKYGLAIADFNGFIGHTGELPGFQSFVAYDPARGATVVVLTNLNNSPNGLSPASQMAILILGKLF